MTLIGAREGDSLALDLTPEQVKRYDQCRLLISVTNEAISGDADLELLEQSKLINLETIEPREELTPTILAKRKCFRYMFR